MAPLVIGSYGIFFRRKRCLIDMAGGRSFRRYAANAFATAGSRGSSIGTLVFGRRALNTPACQSRSSNRSARTSAAPRPYVASSNMIAKSRLPGAFDREIECKILRSEEHTSELQSQSNLVCRLLLEKKKKKNVLSL